MGTDHRNDRVSFSSFDPGSVDRLRRLYEMIAPEDDSILRTGKIWRMVRESHPHQKYHPREYARGSAADSVGFEEFCDWFGESGMQSRAVLDDVEAAIAGNPRQAGHDATFSKSSAVEVLMQVCAHTNTHTQSTRP